MVTDFCFSITYLLHKNKTKFYRHSIQFKFVYLLFNQISTHIPIMMILILQFTPFATVHTVPVVFHRDLCTCFPPDTHFRLYSNRNLLVKWSIGQKLGIYLSVLKMHFYYCWLTWCTYYPSLCLPASTSGWCKKCITTASLWEDAAAAPLVATFHMVNGAQTQSQQQQQQQQTGKSKIKTQKNPSMS